MIRILAVGKVKDKRLSALADDFFKRLRTMAPAEVVELKDSQIEKEGRDMVGKLGSSSGNQLVVAMDEHGEDLTSTELSRLLGERGNICFLVGGADGLGQAARERADRTLRLSSLTMTHEMARVLLLEQIYRGLSILRGKPYHRA
ncbi:MAG: 23S rRNA (pseudouridine(1915)-N(3))-methyltransferase RlmH [Candidatus Krumholzibacteria bacterium]|nr:23S rRNA (pseudouridine(1915)-N(3))-methyltransferase RlmH [Candidatus Krumholzibacteria bacterium]